MTYVLCSGSPNTFWVPDILYSKFRTRSYDSPTPPNLTSHISYLTFRLSGCFNVNSVVLGGYSGSLAYCILSFVEGTMIPPDPPKLTPHLMFHVQALYDFSMIPPDPPLETDMSHLMSYVQALYDFSMIPPPHPNLTPHLMSYVQALRMLQCQQCCGPRLSSFKKTPSGNCRIFTVREN